MSRVDDLQEVTRFCVTQADQHPFIDDQELDLAVLFHQLVIRPFGPGHHDVTEKVRKPDVADTVRLLAGLHPEGARRQALPEKTAANLGSMFNLQSQKNTMALQHRNGGSQLSDQWLKMVRIPHPLAQRLCEGVFILFTVILNEQDFVSIPKKSVRRIRDCPFRDKDFQSMMLVFIKKGASQPLGLLRLSWLNEYQASSDIR